MATKYKKIVVSAKKPLFGRQSEMDKEIAKWTSKGWELTDTTASNVKDHFRLSFEYAADEKGTSGRGRGCLIAFGVIIALVLISNSQKSDTTPINASTKPTSIAQVATQTLDVKTTQQPSKNLSIQYSTSTAVKTDIEPTSAVTPTHTLPTAIPEPTAVFATVKSGTINARSCASTDCAIVAAIASGEKVRIIGQQDNWYLVELDDNKSGYVRSDLLIKESGSSSVSILSNSPTPQASCKPNFMMIGGGFKLENHYDDPEDSWSTYSYSIIDNKTYEAEINFGKNWDTLGAFRVSNFDLDRKGKFLADGIKVNYGFETSIDDAYVALEFDFAYEGRAYEGDIHRFDYDYSSQVRSTTLDFLKRLVGAIMC